MRHPLAALPRLRYGRHAGGEGRRRGQKMHSTPRRAKGRSHVKQFAAALAVGASLFSVAIGPVLAQPVTGETLGQSAVAACTGLTWAQMEAAFGGAVPEVNACRETVHAAILAALALSAVDQERLGLAFTELLRQPVETAAPAPFPAVSYILTTEFEGWVATYCTPPEVAPWALGTLEACTATARMVVVGSQALSAEINSMTANTICGGVLNATPEWRTAAFAVVDELAARAATGTDPVMQVRIDHVVTGLAACR